MKRALVTGGKRGIGRAIAAGLKARGLEVTIGARDPEAGEAVARALGVTWAHVDLSSADTYFPVMDEGRFDVLVNNAGVLIETNMLDAPSDFYESIEVMVNAPYELIRIGTPYWRETGWGRIVNLSSGWGSFAEGLGGPGAYGVAKAALNALTKALPRDLPDGVKVNAMCPGWVRTDMGGPNATSSVEEGADTAIWLATLPDDGPTGKFFRRRKEIAW